MRFFLRKQNRLSHERDIAALFDGGSSLFCHPVRMVYRLSGPSADGASFKAMFIVSKRNFKRAVKRNLIRRRMREIFRLNVHSILDAIPEGQRVDMALSYVFKEVAESAAIEKAVVELFRRLKPKIRGKQSGNQ